MLPEVFSHILHQGRVKREAHDSQVRRTGASMKSGSISWHKGMETRIK